MTKPTRPLHVWMYARASQQYRQEASPERQETDLLKRAEQFVESKYANARRALVGLPEQPHEEVKVIECVKEYGSASKIAFDRRPGFRQLLGAMQKGDVLIVTKLNRIERNHLRQIRAVEQLCITMEIRLIVLDDLAGKELDLTQLQAQLWLHCMAIFAATEHEQRRGYALAQHKRRRDNGIAVKGGDRHGTKYIKHPPENGRSFGWSEEVLDPKQIKVMREIYERQEAGESMGRIGESFERRGVRNRKGRSWLCRSRSGRYSQLYRAYKAYKRLLDDGKLSETCLLAAAERATSSENA